MQEKITNQLKSYNAREMLPLSHKKPLNLILTFKYITFASILIFIVSCKSADAKSPADGWAAAKEGRCDTAEKILKPLVQNQVPEAIKLWADMYALGICKPVDRKKAFSLYSDAAKLGIPTAQYNLGLAYDKAYGTDEDAKLAVHWYRKAATQGVAGAQTNLAVLYFNGRGVDRDDAKAVELTEKAAIQNYAPAQDNLGRIYREGIGRPKDLRKAEYWHRLSAEQGDPQGLVNLGAMNELGLGTPENIALAYLMYSLSAQLGNKLASENKARIETALSPNEITQSKLFVQKWQPPMLLPRTFP